MCQYLPFEEEKQIADLTWTQAVVHLCSPFVKQLDPFFFFFSKADPGEVMAGSGGPRLKKRPQWRPFVLFICPFISFYDMKVCWGYI